MRPHHTIVPPLSVLCTIVVQARAALFALMLLYLCVSREVFFCQLVEKSEKSCFQGVLVISSAALGKESSMKREDLAPALQMILAGRCRRSTYQHSVRNKWYPYRTGQKSLTLI